MPSQLVSSSGCCQPCDSEPVVVNIPGPQGAAGANGTNGTNGIDSFTYTTASFFVPALGASVFAYVTASDFLPESVAGQFFVSVQGLGYMQVTSVDGLRLTLQNPAAGVLSIPNAIPTTLIPAGSLITLAGAVGPQGPAGAAGGASSAGTYIVRTPDASIPSATALDSLSAGYLKTQGSGGFGAVSTVATVPIADVVGTVPIAKGGTNLTTAPANKIPVGDGSTYLQKEIVGTLPIVVTNSAGNITLSAPSVVPFSYVTFTRRVTGIGAANAPLLVGAITANPFSLTAYPSASYAGIDTASGFNSALGRFTVPYTGYYTIDVVLNLDAVTTTSAVRVFIRKTGSDVIASFPFNVTSAGFQPISMNYVDNATSITDYYEIFIQTAHDLYVDQGSSFSVQRIQA
jgi:hypothetical protein